MDAETFTRVVGSAPENDDLDRANCVQAGKLLHEQCGVCAHGLPRFIPCGKCSNKSSEAKPMTDARREQAICNILLLSEASGLTLDAATATLTRSLPVESLPALQRVAQTLKAHTEVERADMAKSVLDRT